MTQCRHKKGNHPVCSGNPFPTFQLEILRRGLTSLRSVLMLALLVLAGAGFTQAQVLYGTLTGNVTDSSGAVIPGASVTATNVATSVVRSTTSTEDGSYLLNDLLPGTYRVTVKANGFTTFHQENVAVLPNTTQRVGVQLQVGSSTEEVTVSSAPPAMQT